MPQHDPDRAAPAPWNHTSWLTLPAVQAHWTRAAPSATDQSAASAHLPLCTAVNVFQSPVPLTVPASAAMMMCG